MSDRDSKIEKWGLSEEAIELYEEKGYGYGRIASHFKQKYPEIDDIRNISHMAVKRFIEKYKEGEVKRQMVEGEDPQEILTQEFQVRMRELINDAEGVKDTSQRLLDKAIGEDASYSDLVKLIRAQRELIDQVRKNIVSLMEFSQMQQRKTENYQNNVIYNIQVNMMEVIDALTEDMNVEARERAVKRVKNILEVEHDGR